jgi:hypothetical protein
MEDRRYVGDSSRRITVELPPTFEDLEHLCLTSFGMVGPVTIYKNGVANLTADDYRNIRSGETFVVVDSRGNAVDMRDFFVSTYDRDYTAKPLEARQAAAPPQDWRKVPDNRTFRTNYDDYEQWPIEKRQPPAPVERPPSMPFNGTTEHRDEFSPHKMPPRQHGAPPPEFRKVPDSRNFAPESSEFRAWELPRREPVPEAQRAESLPFKARSSYQDDYPAHEVQRRAAAPAQEWQPSGVPFNAQSTTAADYQKWDIAPRDAPHQVARPPPSMPFNARSTAQDDFRVRGGDGHRVALLLLLATAAAAACCCCCLLLPLLAAAAVDDDDYDCYDECFYSD